MLKQQLNLSLYSVSCRLNELIKIINDRQHAGLKITNEQWSDLYQLQNKMNDILLKHEKQIEGQKRTRI